MREVTFLFGNERKEILKSARLSRAKESPPCIRIIMMTQFYLVKLEILLVTPNTRASRKVTNVSLISILHRPLSRQFRFGTRSVELVIIVKWNTGAKWDRRQKKSREKTWSPKNIFFYEKFQISGDMKKQNSINKFFEWQGMIGFFFKNNKIGSLLAPTFFSNDKRKNIWFCDGKEKNG